MAKTTKTKKTAKPARPAPAQVGRPPSEFEERYQVRHHPDQRAAWEAAAVRDGRDLQNWIRRTLDSAAAQ